MSLQSLSKQEKDSFNKLNEKKIGASLTGYVLSTIHRELVTELFNKETKGSTSGLFRCDVSTNIASVNTWVNSLRIHTILKVV